MDTQTKPNSKPCSYCDCKTNLCERCEKEYAFYTSEKMTDVWAPVKKLLKEIEDLKTEQRKFIYNLKFSEDFKEEIEESSEEINELTKIANEIRNAEIEGGGYEVGRFGLYKKITKFTIYLMTFEKGSEGILMKVECHNPFNSIEKIYDSLHNEGLSDNSYFTYGEDTDGYWFNNIIKSKTKEEVCKSMRTMTKNHLTLNFKNLDFVLETEPRKEAFIKKYGNIF